MTQGKTFGRTERTTLKRLPMRAKYERNTIYEILDEGFVCHVGFIDAGRPVVIPTAYGRLKRHALYSRLGGQPHAAHIEAGR
jgi:nitroimidazol reductase NimA-like FMN-containing flavoprotein (pyridoxamine 5'-phosphate oxidase superfamily)